MHNDITSNSSPIFLEDSAMTRGLCVSYIVLLVLLSSFFPSDLINKTKGTKNDKLLDVQCLVYLTFDKGMSLLKVERQIQVFWSSWADKWIPRSIPAESKMKVLQWVTPTQSCLFETCIYSVRYDWVRQWEQEACSCVLALRPFAQGRDLILFICLTESPNLISLWISHVDSLLWQKVIP